LPAFVVVCVLNSLSGHCHMHGLLFAKLMLLCSGWVYIFLDHLYLHVSISYMYIYIRVSHGYQRLWMGAGSQARGQKWTGISETYFNTDI
jgi:hypothetical protein